MTDYVFAYGSLLSPGSLALTLPTTRLTDIVGARLTGFVRTFDVAFPNDGSQGDKAYFSPSGGRPSHVLFANVVAISAGEAVNGVLVPMEPGDLALLVNRERRYELLEVTDSVRLMGVPEGPAGTVCAFVGRAEFTRPADVARGVLSREYVNAVADGVRFWSGRYPGFDQEYYASTRLPTGVPMLDLTRVEGLRG
ncbi:MAG: hypothetical protein E6Q90_00980 [Actinobacteria bacterium]|nr:MAG: hypothetical protein E6Q90_00980 [Actinomycetota bacterium]